MQQAEQRGYVLVYVGGWGEENKGERSTCQRKRRIYSQTVNRVMLKKLVMATHSTVRRARERVERILIVELLCICTAKNNFNQDKPHRLHLDLGDTVIILRQNVSWYYGYKKK